MPWRKTHTLKNHAIMLNTWAEHLHKCNHSKTAMFYFGGYIRTRIITHHASWWWQQRLIRVVINLFLSLLLSGVVNAGHWWQQRFPSRQAVHGAVRRGRVSAERLALSIKLLCPFPVHSSQGFHTTRLGTFLHFAWTPVLHPRGGGGDRVGVWLLIWALPILIFNCQQAEVFISVRDVLLLKGTDLWHIGKLYLLGFITCTWRHWCQHRRKRHLWVVNKHLTIKINRRSFKIILRDGSPYLDRQLLLERFLAFNSWSHSRQITFKWVPRALLKYPKPFHKWSGSLQPRLALGFVLVPCAHHRSCAKRINLCV